MQQNKSQEKMLKDQYYNICVIQYNSWLSTLIGVLVDTGQGDLILSTFAD